MSESTKSRPTIVITTGDPQGIGPEITSKALKNHEIKNRAEFIVIGDISRKQEIVGRPSVLGGRQAVDNIKEAVSILNSIKTKKALVTAPINKFSLKKAGFKFHGHTELLSSLTNSKDVAMMFAANDFRIALVTRHISLTAVPKALTQGKIIKTTELFYYALKNYFKIKKPMIGIAPLNPHAGEKGVMGKEEGRIIMPALRRLKGLLNCKLIFKAPDVLFHSLYEKKLDGVVCMYHDQGLIPFKMLYFEKGVNLTLGLPFIRTSPDHGTAFDIAGKGVAGASSMIEAVKLAIRLAKAC